MRWIDLAHRWLGGLIGLLLAAIGLSGAVLLHKDAWTAVSHKGDAVVRDADRVAAMVARTMADPVGRPRMITFAAPGFGVDRLAYEKGAGAYADQDGGILSRWDNQWSRPEMWLVDFHEHLLSGESGETIVGVAGLAGLVFVVTGTILWWRTRRTFEFRLLPKRLSRPAIVRHHRDLGILVAPLLLLSFVTGTILIFRPLSSVLLGPGATAAIVSAAKGPPAPSGDVGPDVDWRGMIRTAHTRFPEADFRSLSLPRKTNGLIVIRMKQPWEWLPNGRTTLWFAAGDGHLLAARDPADAPAQVGAYNRLFPLHAGKVGGLAYRLVMTLSGLGLALLGSLTVWSFWFKRKAPPKRAQPNARMVDPVR
ncbi:PepSY domain-containing protein [Sphingomonas sp. AP4-R1]|uniref:PepSY-associated TM helix domain-containing protein n=1 Tax=Sphingomonas sp. AP4-R1 TaxID=2735134 RepID=UPI001493CBB6|nr:PepSY-associated TM helix domain-containing protein [Sphingomonas sp. AP4-R1]QJU59157.1 PepSY domain-containing protein [Sphingomonas sp. AP4-R1]